MAPSSVISTFEWNIDSNAELGATAAAQIPSRLDENGLLISFGIWNGEDLDAHPRILVPAECQQRLEVFLQKFFLTCIRYTYVPKKGTGFLTFRRLTAYVLYSYAILSEIRRGNFEILDEWWTVEATHEFLQHSPGRVAREGGPLSDEDVVAENNIWWGSHVFADEPMALNWAKIPLNELDDPSRDVGDRFYQEVEREFGSGWVDKYGDELEESGGTPLVTETSVPESPSLRYTPEPEDETDNMDVDSAVDDLKGKSIFDTIVLFY
ncbi:hypothetical protein D9619_007918 [Psilocybe cf. subviscida]|uniref:Uncharacterized protein n=1 Tax=Psilocybe cf. subviscida TaxID=2480587 RepID=A0A8H5ATR4_9AGAR|nr:hypothetical protein D9619_007918 [Psilocybe cf. subviscida]